MGYQQSSFFGRRWRRLILASSALAVTLPAAAWAQDDPDAAAKPVAKSTDEQGASQQTEEDRGLETIVVTARKREENLQDTPISISAFSSDTLNSRQVTNIAEIGNFAPNVSFEKGAASSGSSFVLTTFIRGVGQSDFNLTIDPGVGLYVDGVYVSRSVGALLDTADVQSVQVLRGPQGTLFGKNTIGGAIVVTSKKPSSSFEAEAEATTGRYNRADFRGMLNVPVSDILKLRATVSYQSRDGYVKRLVDGEKMGNQNSLAGRLQALIEPSSNFSILLSGDYTHTREEALPTTLLAVNGSTDPSLNLFSQFYNWVAAPIAAGHPPLTICGAPGVPAPTSDPRCYSSRWITGNNYTTNASAPNTSDLDLWGVSAVMDWDIGVANLKSITAYRKLSSHFFLDNDSSPLHVLEASNDYYQKQFSQEFQLTGKAFDDRLNWLVGLFYLKEKGTDRNHLIASLADFLSGGFVDNDSYAAFAQGTYKLTDALSVTLGGRYTDETKRFLPDQLITLDKTGGSILFLSRLFIPDLTLNPNGDRILPPIWGTTRSKEFTPSVSVDYRLTPDVLGYVSYSKGFKSGGFTQRVFPPLPQVPNFNPEFVTSYEAGIKTEFFDHRLRVNAAAFLAHYNGLQITVFDPSGALFGGATPTTRNAGRARIQGFELETETRLAEWLLLNGDLGYTDAKYVEVSPLATEVTLNSKLPYVPKWTATGGVTIGSFELPFGKISFRGDVSYKGSQFLTANNTPVLFQKAVTLVSASASISDQDEHWTLSAGVTNLTNEKYLTAGYESLGAAGFAEGTYSRGSEWFLRLRYRY
uniref:TonB-dependent receptor n=1 Tax=Altererythrobacter segetis TaxID=1104773 RepID=UPI00140BBA4E|nr:TonB-dependent receptor [Altererythrobacter segetis]